MNTAEEAATVDLGWGTFPASRLRYMVRTCVRVYGRLQSPSDDADGFIWPSEVGAVVEAPDWRPDDACGRGLHGLQAGQQTPGVWATGPNAVWMIVAYDVAESVNLSGKTKVRRCRIEMVVDEADGASTAVPLWLRARGVTAPIYRETVIVGDAGTAVAGDGGAATAGAFGTAVAGHHGIATAGVYGTAVAGDGGAATAGAFGIATVGGGGVAMAGIYGTIVAAYHNGIRQRLHVGYIGEAGLLPDVPYRVEVVCGVLQWVQAVSPPFPASESDT